ncbi:cache domain-containing protein [Halapricum salinum]|uniref:Cache domain-containing protein n=1 Tax=Halapricum salinum TaxID=1457250 RepID=A0A4D6HD64_9EURY|nr:cache domain-containing protein [Halapricum salinum]QCC50657.1 hypothetical protein DV733_05095 [Halapricum salinum]
MNVSEWGIASRRSLAVVMLLSVLVASFGVVSAGSSDAGQETVCEQQVEATASQQASNAADAVNRWIRTQSQEVAQLGRQPIVERGNASEIQSWFLSERNQNADWGRSGATVHYVDLDREEVLASTDPTSYEGSSTSELNNSLSAVLEDARIGQGVSRTDAYVDQSGTVRVSFVQVIAGDSETTRAIVYSVAPHAAASELLDQPGDSGVTMVVDAQNRILMDHTGSTGLQLRSYSASAWEQPILEARAAGGGETSVQRAPEPASGILSGEVNGRVTEYGLRGERYLVASAKVPTIAQTGIAQDVQWIVLVHSPCSSSLDGDEQQSGDANGETGSGFGPGYGLGVAILAVSLLGIAVVTACGRRA